MANFAVTGATGFIGRALTRILLERGHSVKALSRQANSDLSNRIHAIPGTLSDRSSLDQLVAGVDGVIHLAGTTAARDRSSYYTTNAAGTTHLLNAIEARPISLPLIHVSSLAAREPGLSDYAASKRAGEAIVQSAELPWTIIRPPAVYGPGDVGLSPLWACLKRGWLPQISPQNARFSLIYVDDLAEAIARIAERILGTHPICSSLHHRILEIDDQFEGELGRGYGWGDITQIAEDIFSKRPRVVAVPPPVLKGLAAGSERIGRMRNQPAIFNLGKVRELSHTDWVVKDIPDWAKLSWTPSRQLRDTLAYL